MFDIFGWDFYKRREANRALALSSFGSIAAGFSVATVILKFEFLSQTFALYSMAVALVLFVLDFYLIPQHYGLQVFTNKYWTQTELPNYARALAFLLLIFLFVLCAAIILNGLEILKFENKPLTARGKDIQMPVTTLTSFAVCVIWYTLKKYLVRKN